MLNHRKINYPGIFLRYCATFLLILLQPVTSKGQHFQPVWNNNPFQPMSFVILSAVIDDETLQPGDEIAVFDIETASGQEICVGAVPVNEGSGPYFFSASGDDPGTSQVQEGFIPGNSIIFRIWDSSEGVEITFIHPGYYPSPGYFDTYACLETAVVNLQGVTNHIWTGLVSEDWDDAGNWKVPLVPDDRVKVFIPGTPDGPYFPVIYSGNAICREIFVGANASLTLMGGLELVGY